MEQSGGREFARMRIRSGNSERRGSMSLPKRPENDASAPRRWKIQYAAAAAAFMCRCAIREAVAAPIVPTPAEVGAGARLQRECEPFLTPALTIA